MSETIETTLGQPYQHGNPADGDELPCAIYHSAERISLSLREPGSLELLGGTGNGFLNFFGG